jgi:hypothetical protein
MKLDRGGLDRGLGHGPGGSRGDTPRSAHRSMRHRPAKSTTHTDFFLARSPRGAGRVSEPSACSRPSSALRPGAPGFSPAGRRRRSWSAPLSLWERSPQDVGGEGKGETRGSRPGEVARLSASDHACLRAKQARGNGYAGELFSFPRSRVGTALSTLCVGSGHRGSSGEREDAERPGRVFPRGSVGTRKCVAHGAAATVLARSPSEGPRPAPMLALRAGLGRAQSNSEAL